MKLDVAIAYIETLTKAVEQAKREGRDELRETDLDPMFAEAHSALAEFQATIDRKKEDQ